MSGSTHVCSADELEPGDHVVTEKNGIEVGVVNVEGDYYAMANRCPHQGGPICRGQVKRKREVTSAEPGERVEVELSDERTISCPRHGWEYDLESGVHLGDPEVSLPTFEVEVVDGEIYLAD